MQRNIWASPAVPKERPAGFVQPFEAQPNLVGSAALDPTYRQQLEESIQDELADVAFYAGIANEAPNETLRLLVVSIVGDEYAHARTQAALLGQAPPPPSPPIPPQQLQGFRQDVMRAIKGEISAVARYADLAALAPTTQIRYLLTSILGDEYGHIRTWTAMLNQL
ncbi:MAG TPA: ferritin-like domain-containing protein [Limnochordia bacterium]|nr:ferritin-like domain-containing protein [Limnochordia bacterium]